MCQGEDVLSDSDYEFRDERRVNDSLQRRKWRGKEIASTLNYSIVSDRRHEMSSG